MIFLLDDRRIRIQEAQKLTDPDPQHWLKLVFSSFRSLIANPQTLTLLILKDRKHREGQNKDKLAEKERDAKKITVL